MSTRIRTAVAIVAILALSCFVSAGGSGSCVPMPLDSLCFSNADCILGEESCLGGVCTPVCSPPGEPQTVCWWCVDGEANYCGPWSCFTDSDCPPIDGEVGVCEWSSQKGGGDPACVWYPIEEPECVEDCDCPADGDPITDDLCVDGVCEYPIMQVVEGQSCSSQDDCPDDRYFCGPDSICWLDCNLAMQEGSPCLNAVVCPEPECYDSSDCRQDQFCHEGKCWLECQPGVMQQGSPCEHVRYDTTPPPPTGVLVTWGVVETTIVPNDGVLVAYPHFTSLVDEDQQVTIVVFRLILSRLQMSEGVGDCYFVWGDGQHLSFPTDTLSGEEMLYTYYGNSVILPMGETEVPYVECDLIGSFDEGDTVAPKFLGTEIYAVGQETATSYTVEVEFPLGPTLHF